MALQALASFGMKSSGNGETKVQIDVESSAGKFSFPEINSINDMVLQKQKVHLCKMIWFGVSIQLIFMAYQLPVLTSKTN